MIVDLLRPLVLRVLRVPPEPIDPAGGHESLRVFRAAENYLRYRQLAWVIKQLAAIAGLVVGLFMFREFVMTRVDHTTVRTVLIVAEVVAVLTALGSIVFSYVVLVLDYENRWYKVTDRSLRIREGVVHVREMTMTFANIQNIEITQGPLQRMLGIADLKVQTAGGGGGATSTEGGNDPILFSMHIGYFRGVDNAVEIRDLMTERLRWLRDAGLGDVDDTSADTASAPQGPAPALAAVLEGMRREAADLRAAAERLAVRGGV
jgi:uncharacterized membrane protein YdbT with pleckstrin-like domain